ncbi:DNA-binding response regulator [Chitinophaga lutea]|uniref:DNA-binding response regulator n=1 Tax=Chitinophaga lutea TaxID=2488634 RepID=A0A3N4PJT6_9BACT|nr:LytTR family DNA-binding domain-containing protein [Chitinophaga lutea]RPE08932.1 DNA-binding response regulator [Chitinophaga lutea]
MKVIIIEDENLAIKRLIKLISGIDGRIEVVATLRSIAESVSWLSEHPAPDLIFMDIELADGQSFEIFKQVTVTSPVIFTTSYDQYALRAFEVNSVDYLLKPVEPEGLAQALNKHKAIQAHYAGQAVKSVNITRLLNDLRESFDKKQYRKRFLVKSGNKQVSIETEEIAYFYRDGRITFFRTFGNGKFITDYTLEELEDEMLDPSLFFRINRSCIVAIKSVRTIESFPGNRLHLDLSPAFDKDSIVSRDKVAAFKDWIGK